MKPLPYRMANSFALLASVVAIMLAGSSARAALEEITGLRAISAGSVETCAINAAGGVLCWGNDTGLRPAPPVAGLESGIAAVSVGASHACALTTSGGVKCWGSGSYGQLGGGGALQPPLVDVVGLASGATAISSGSWHTCAITSQGGVKCWGYGFALGNGQFADSNTPVDVVGLSSGVTAIAAGRSSTCALLVSGAVKCWGDNASGALGNPSVTTASNVPVDVESLASGASAISAGDYHACALMVGGNVRCWGTNDAGQLGDASTALRRAPVDVQGLSAVYAIEAGGEHTCALTTAGAVKCWGSNAFGQIGDGALQVNRTVPVQVTGLASGVTAIASGWRHACALLASGAARCWGNDWWGQLGDREGLVEKSPVPLDVVGLSGGASQLSSGGGHACVLMVDGAMKCWGANYLGVLGYSTESHSSRNAPVTFPAPAGVTAIAAGLENTCLLLGDATVRCWHFSTGLTQVTGLAEGATSISAGNEPGGFRLQPHGRACAVTTLGGVKCWYHGAQAFPVAGLESGVSSVSVGSWGAKCVLTTTGGVKCLGENGAGQLGRGSAGAADETPMDVTGLTSGVVSVQVGGFHACALMATGGVKCWGQNTNGAVGDGTTTPRYTPVDVAGLSAGVASISAGPDHTCAVTTAGSAKCWGQNTNGELGDGTFTARLAPVDVIGLSSGVARISDSCALMTSGAVKCWGHNVEGQLGDGSRADRSVPVPVMISSQVDLGITQAVPASGNVGKDLVYTVVVSNSGLSPASNVVVTDALPGGSTFVWASLGCVRAGNSLTCAVGSLAAGASATFKVVIRPSAEGTGTSTNIATVSADSDSTPGNNTSTASVWAFPTPAGVAISRYRLYSDVTKEHHFTTDLNEYTVLGASGNWVQEGTVGKVLNNPGSHNGVQAVPYYRLYNQATRWHHWTTDANEYYTLIQFPNWDAEGVDGYILPTQAPGTIELYRLNYPFLPGLHHWTIDANEYSTLIASYGWEGEPGAGFVIP